MAKVIVKDCGDCRDPVHWNHPHGPTPQEVQRGSIGLEGELHHYAADDKEEIYAGSANFKVENRIKCFSVVDGDCESPDTSECMY